MENQKKQIKLLRRRNELAFRQLVEEHKNMVFRTAYGFLHDHQESEDLAQEVFLEVFNSIDSFKGDSKLSTWIYRITVNKSLNELRRKKRRGQVKEIGSSFDPDNNQTMEIEDDPNQTPVAINENQERKHILEQAINTLPENQKTAFVLHKYDEMPYKKIAEVMDSSLSSVESLIHRAKLNLQKKLLEYYKQ